MDNGVFLQEVWPGGSFGETGRPGMSVLGGGMPHLRNVDLGFYIRFLQGGT